MVGPFFDAPGDLGVEVDLDVLLLLAHEDSERLCDVACDIKPGGREHLFALFEVADAMDRQRRDPLVVADAGEQIQNRRVRDDLQRAHAVRARRALPCGVVLDGTDATPGDRVDELVDVLAVGSVVDVGSYVRREHARQRIEATIVMRREEPADLLHGLVEVLVKRGARHRRKRGQGGVDREQLG